jgi:hypothetical protein
MAEHMLPPAPPAQQTGEGYSALFKVPVTLVDEQGKHWMVQYEGSSYRDQKHPRLTRGWRDFVRANNIQIGEQGASLLRSLLWGLLFVVFGSEVSCEHLVPAHYYHIS